MASPLTKRYKWPTDKTSTITKKSSGRKGSNFSDFVPYISNLANAFMRAPKPMAPKLIDPVAGTRISMDDARRQVSDQTRAADLATSDLDAQTGAAIRVGNLGSKFRALSDINSREAQTNAQMGNQTKYINANIAAQNAAATNAYQDDLVNSKVAQIREQTANLSNAADKFIAQRAAKDEMALDKEKAIISSKAYNQGVYDRLMTSLNQSGVDTSGFTGKGATPGTTTSAPSTKVPQTLNIAKYKAMVKPLALDLNTKLPDPTLKKMKQFYQNRRNFYAAGGMMKVYGEGPGPGKPLLKSPVQPVRQFMGDAGVSGVNAFSTQLAMDSESNRTAHGIDLVNSVVSSGMLPNQTEEDSILRTTLDPKIYNYLYEFNQRSDLQKMTPEQKIQSFYSIPSNDPDIQSMKDNMKRFGHGPVGFWRGQKLAGVTPKSAVTKRGLGGRLIKPFK